MINTLKSLCDTSGRAVILLTRLASHDMNEMKDHVDMTHNTQRYRNTYGVTFSKLMTELTDHDT